MKKRNPTALYYSLGRLLTFAKVASIAHFQVKVEGRFSLIDTLETIRERMKALGLPTTGNVEEWIDALKEYKEGSSLETHHAKALFEAIYDWQDEVEREMLRREGADAPTIDELTRERSDIGSTLVARFSSGMIGLMK